MKISSIGIGEVGKYSISLSHAELIHHFVGNVPTKSDT